MRIGQLGQATSVDIETIRFYEKSGLLPAPVRSDNGYRSYNQAHLERLAFIRHCRSLDISLTEIKQLLDFVANPEAECADINRLIDTQLVKVKARLASMKALEKQLIALKGCCGSSQTAGECGILHELVSAARKESCICHAETTNFK